jgi:hypothetical protein
MIAQLLGRHLVGQEEVLLSEPMLAIELKSAVVA